MPANTHNTKSLTLLLLTAEEDRLVGVLEHAGRVLVVGGQYVLLLLQKLKTEIFDNAANTIVTWLDTRLARHV